MSNWTIELCEFDHATFNTVCDTNTFLDLAYKNSQVNHTSLVLIDCALAWRDASDWISDSDGSYTTCLNNNLTPRGLSEKHVQVVLWKDANLNPVNPLTSEPGDTPTQYCQNHPTQQACIYEGQVGQIARFVKTRYVNVQQMFVHARIYAGYSVTNQTEPFAYEQGLATKWLVAAQVTQMASGVVDAVAGDLGTAIAPWIGWGPYFWASGTTPRSDGLTYVLADFGSDGVHPTASGILKVANMMMGFYPTSTLTPWFAPKKK